MKIAFIGFENVENPLLWAGIPYAILTELKKSDGVIVESFCCENERIIFPLKVLLKRFFYNKILKYKYGVYRFDRSEWFIKQKSKELNNKIYLFNPDLILCCTPYQIIGIENSAPVYIYTDATFNLLINNYPDYKRYSLQSKRVGESIEKKALQKAKKIIYSSNWAKDSAINTYNISASKLSVIPFGSNLILDEETKIDFNKKIDKNNFNLIFVGFDPKRKGLDKVIDFHRNLLKKSINSNLFIIGPKQLSKDHLNIKNINFLGKLDKTVPSENAILINTYQKGHFFILPADVEAFGIVYCEAASLALPSISNNLGGVDDIIKHKLNGLKFDPMSSVDKMVESTMEFIIDQQKYTMLRKNTYQYYLEKLNWHQSIQKLIKELE